MGRSGFTGLRFYYDQWISFQFSSIKHARTLYRSLLTFDKHYLEPDPAALAHLFFLHLRHAFSCEVEPFARDHHTVFWCSVRDRRFQTFFDERVGQVTMTKL